MSETSKSRWRKHEAKYGKATTFKILDVYASLAGGPTHATVHVWRPKGKFTERFVRGRNSTEFVYIETWDPTGRQTPVSIDYDDPIKR